MNLFVVLVLIVSAVSFGQDSDDQVEASPDYAVVLFRAPFDVEGATEVEAKQLSAEAARSVEYYQRIFRHHTQENEPLNEVPTRPLAEKQPLRREILFAGKPQRKQLPNGNWVLVGKHETGMITDDLKVVEQVRDEAKQQKNSRYLSVQYSLTAESERQLRDKLIDAVKRKRAIE